MGGAMSKGPEGRIALVTGAGRGIGAATARWLARHGHRVALGARTMSEVESVVREIEAEQGAGTSMALVLDVSDPKQVASAFDRIESQWGVVRVLVNNAAALIRGEVASMPLEDFERTMAVNVRGSFVCAQELFRRIARPEADKGTEAGASERGCIVNLSSLGGIRGTTKFPGLCAYTTSKHAVVGLTESLAVEGKRLGIRVNCVAPGAVATRMLQEAAPFLKTSTRPEDIAEIIGYLCDPVRARSLNGAVIEVHSNE